MYGKLWVTYHNSISLFKTREWVGWLYGTWCQRQVFQISQRSLLQRGCSSWPTWDFDRRLHFSRPIPLPGDMVSLGRPTWLSSHRKSQNPHRNKNVEVMDWGHENSDPYITTTLAHLYAGTRFVAGFDDSSRLRWRHAKLFEISTNPIAANS